MIIIRTWEELASALAFSLEPTTKAILIEHRDRLAEYDDHDLGDLAVFCIVETGDQPSALEEASGIAILVDPPEYIDRNVGWWECCWIVSDDGFGWVVLIPDAPGTNPALLKLCRVHNADA